MNNAGKVKDTLKHFFWDQPYAAQLSFIHQHLFGIQGFLP
jgi:hypothetical protein